MLLAIPALRALRAGPGGRPLTLAAQPRIGALLAALAEVDRAIAFDSLRLETLFVPPDAGEPSAELSAADRVVCWFGARDAAFAARLAALTPGAIVAPPAQGDLVWRGLLDSVAAAEGDAAAEPDLRSVRVPAALVAEGRRALAGLGWNGRAPVVMAHPGAGGVAKRWPVEGFEAVLVPLADATGAALVVHQGPADAAAVAALAARLRGRAACLVDPELPVLAGALTVVSLFVGNDSGISHLAAAVGTPTLALFTTAAWPWRPWSPRARALAVATSELAPGDVDAVLRAARSSLA